MARRRLSRTIARARSMSSNRRSNNRNAQATPNQATDSNNNVPSAQSFRNQRSLSVPPTNCSSVLRRHQETFFTNPNLNDAPVIQIYTDGSCYPNSESGIGVFFGENHELNLSHSLPPPHDSGLAEISAARIGLTALRNWSKYNSENVTLKTDYLGIIHALQKPELSSGRFANEYRRLHTLAQSFPRGVLFEHVSGHTGIPGNEACFSADELARRSTSTGRSRSRTTSRSRSRSRTRKNSSSASAQARPRSVYIPAVEQTRMEPDAIVSEERIGRSQTTRVTANTSELKINSDIQQPAVELSGQEAEGSESEDETEEQTNEESDKDPDKKI